MSKEKLAQVFHFDLYGKREDKYDFLDENSIESIPFRELPNVAPNYFFVNKNFDEQLSYDLGFSLVELFPLNNVGIVTARDNFTIHSSKEEVEKTINEFLTLDDETARIKFDLGKDVRDWQVNYARKDLQNSYPNKGVFTQIAYRPFDNRWTFYTGNSKGFHCYPRQEVMKHFTMGKNIGLIIGRQGQAVGAMPWNLAFIANSMTDLNIYYRGGGTTFPLYLYPEANNQLSIGESQNRVPNLNMALVKKIEESLGLTFTTEKFPSDGGVPNGRGGKNITPSKLNSTINKHCLNEQIGEYITPSTPNRATKNYMALPYNANLKARAKELRQVRNLPEVLFWNQVKNKQFKSLDFDRQKIIGNYIVDFYCANCQVVIEIEGSSYDSQQQYDADRDSHLTNLGLTVIRIAVEKVLHEMDSVIQMLLEHPAFKISVKENDFDDDNASDTHPNSELLDHPALPGSPPSEGNFAPIDLLDYIYAVLHAPAYREKYKEFLKIDFPRVPYPSDVNNFWQLVQLGSQLRKIHLLESKDTENYITKYPEDGDNMVEKIRYDVYPNEAKPLGEDYLGSVYINDAQYFAHVPITAWEFYIGGYQPAQKWLKDRKGRALSFEDILHYQKIIVALKKTCELMKEINRVLVV